MLNYRLLRKLCLLFSLALTFYAAPAGAQGWSDVIELDADCPGNCDEQTYDHDMFMAQWGYPVAYYGAQRLIPSLDQIVNNVYEIRMTHCLDWKPPRLIVFNGLYKTLATDKRGNVMIVFERNQRIFTKIFQPGVGWLAEDNVQLFRDKAKKVVAACDNRGNFMVVAQTERPILNNVVTKDIVANYYLRGAGWQGEKLLADHAKTPQLVYHTDRTFMATYVMEGPQNKLVARQFVGIGGRGWQRVSLLDAGVNPFYRLGLTADAAGHVFAMYFRDGLPGLMSRRYDMSRRIWQAPVQLSNGGIVHMEGAAIHSLPGGGALAVFFELADDGIGMVMLENRYLNRAGWTGPQEIEELPDPDIVQVTIRDNCSMYINPLGDVAVGFDMETDQGVETGAIKRYVGGAWLPLEIVDPDIDLFTLPRVAIDLRGNVAVTSKVEEEGLYGITYTAVPPAFPDCDE